MPFAVYKQAGEDRETMRMHQAVPTRSARASLSRYPDKIYCRKDVRVEVVGEDGSSRSVETVGEGMQEFDVNGRKVNVGVWNRREV